MSNLKGKKLLVLGGAFQHCKLVEAAHELGVEVIVTDYLPLEQAPAKQIADKYYMYNITDIDEIVEMCIKENVDGVISTSLDACQKPYQQICEKLGLPCFGTKKQFEILTNKRLFKEYCLNNGVDVIPEYSVDDFECSENIEYPIFVKPTDSRGSRGQNICNTFEEVRSAIEFAKSESISGEVVIEKYMGQDNDFSITAMVINGKVFPFRTVDRFLGKKEDGLDKLAVGAIMPSKHTNLYIDSIHDKFEKFILSVGLVTAPVFMQGFVDGETIRFYDPGLRLPGGEYERMFKAITGKNILYPLIEFALSGSVIVNDLNLDVNSIWINNKYAIQILPTLRSGRISLIKGFDKVRNHPSVISIFERYVEGDEIFDTHNVNQRFCEIDIVCDSRKQVKEVVDYVYEVIEVLDENGKNMITSVLDTDCFLIDER